MLKTMTLGLALASAAASAAPPMPAAADDATPQSLPLSAPGTESLTVVRDAVTGKLRQPTAQELVELQRQMQLQRAQQRIAPAAPLTKYHRSGAVGVRVTDDMIGYSVLVRRRDGSLAEQHFSSKQEAEAAVRAGAVTDTSALPTE